MSSAQQLEVDRHNWEKFYAIVLYVIQFRRLETATPDASFDWLKEISLASPLPSSYTRHLREALDEHSCDNLLVPILSLFYILQLPIGVPRSYGGIEFSDNAATFRRLAYRDNYPDRAIALHYMANNIAVKMSEDSSRGYRISRHADDRLRISHTVLYAVLLLDSDATIRSPKWATFLTGIRQIGGSDLGPLVDKLEAQVVFVQKQAIQWLRPSPTTGPEVDLSALLIAQAQSPAVKRDNLRRRFQARFGDRGDVSFFPPHLFFSSPLSSGSEYSSTSTPEYSSSESEHSSILSSPRLVCINPDRPSSVITVIDSPSDDLSSVASSSFKDEFELTESPISMNDGFEDDVDLKSFSEATGLEAYFRSLSLGDVEARPQVVRSVSDRSIELD